MINKRGISGLFACLLAGCSMTPSMPDFERLPVVNFGEPVPQNQEYILHFSANEPITTNIKIEGNLLQNPANETLAVKLTKDIYAYKEWVSFDKTNWSIARDVMEIRTLIKIPGTRHPEPGIIQIKVNEKPPIEN